MSDITQRIATEHLATSTSGCTCGGVPLGGSYPGHVAEVTEAAVRAQIAADIESWQFDQEGDVLTHGAWSSGARYALAGATGIARGCAR